LVATPAAGRACQPGGAVGSMTTRTVGGDLPMGSPRLLLVAGRAARNALSSGVLIVTTCARPMPDRGRLALRGMTIPTSFVELFAVRIVAGQALCMPLAYLLLHPLMARAARRIETLWVVRQAPMATRTCPVSLVGCDFGDVFGVALRTQRHVSTREQEGVRLVTATARHAFVK
jgi:hypothetical protein